MSSVVDQSCPATVFLSYKREDAEEVKYLQQQIKVRGVRAWRDVTNLPLGGSNEREIVRAIEQECDVFVLYVTPQCLVSDFIWETEVPTALNRWKRDQAFNVVAILRGVTNEELQGFCAAHGYRSLKEFNNVDLLKYVKGGDEEEFESKLTAVARDILKAAFDLRLRRIGVDRDHNYEASISFRTFLYSPSTPSLDLDIDWTEGFEGKDEVPPHEVWKKTLLPALEDMKNVLSETIRSRKLHLFLDARLPAAFALGAALPANARFKLLLEADNDVWSASGTTTEPSSLSILAYPDKGDAHVALVELAISRETAPGLAQSLPSLNLSFKNRLRFEPEDGRPRTSFVRDGFHALTISREIGQELRNLCDKGVSHIHLFAALPVELAVMVGHQFNALCAVTLYNYKSLDKIYVPVCTLR